MLRASRNREWQQRLAAAACGAAGGAAVLWCWERREPQKQVQANSDVAALAARHPLNHYAEQFGLPTVEDPLLLYQEHIVRWDSRAKTCKYVLEKLDPESIAGKADRDECTFLEESRLEPQYRNKLSDFKRSDFDR